MHVLITGANGQLGSAVCAAFGARAGVRLTEWTIDDADLADPGIVDMVGNLAPDLIVNTAAWTNVDGAEAQPDEAYAANALGPLHLATACDRCGAALVQISTNEVFPGIPGTYYREYDATGAGSTYARSKLAGERAVGQLLRRLYIVRVAWLFGPGGQNFPLKIVSAADRMDSLRVVGDEFGNPTYAPDAAAAIVDLVETDRYGIYHLVNEGWCSRYQLAKRVLELSGRSHVEITPISLKEWPRPARAPMHAVLINQAAAALGIVLRPGGEALEEYCRTALVGV